MTDASFLKFSEIYCRISDGIGEVIARPVGLRDELGSDLEGGRGPLGRFFSIGRLMPLCGIRIKGRSQSLHQYDINKAISSARD